MLSSIRFKVETKSFSSAFNKTKQKKESINKILTEAQKKKKEEKLFEGQKSLCSTLVLKNYSIINHVCKGLKSLIEFSVLVKRTHKVFLTYIQAFCEKCLNIEHTCTHLYLYGYKFSQDSNTCMYVCMTINMYMHVCVCGNVANVCGFTYKAFT